VILLIAAVVIAEPTGGSAFETVDHFIECPDVAPATSTHKVFVKEYKPSSLKTEVPIVCVHGA
jgi:hypothetical protein